MKVSIIIINKNDIGIKRTLEALSKMAANINFEIIVVDNSNHKLDWVKIKYLNTKWIYFESNNKNITIPEQRNVGVRNASGEVIIFLDASCIPEKNDWLKEMTDPIVKENENLVRGAIANKENYITVTEKNGKKIYVSESPTMNMAVKKSIFDKIGLFDESFSYGSDMDFSWRAIKAGYKVRYIATALITHDYGNLKQNLKRYFYYGEARVRLYSKHPDKLILMKNYEIKSLVYFFAFTLFPFIFISKYYLFVLSILLILPLPKNPFKELQERYIFSLGLLIGFLRMVRNN